MRSFVFAISFLCLGAAVPALAVDSTPLPQAVASGPSSASPAPLPLQLPTLLPSGAVNLDQAWVEEGGARLYWNTLVIPRQVRMGGARFADPAAVPELLPRSTKKDVRPARRQSRPAQATPAQASPEKQKAAQQSAPAGAGKTALRPPAAQGGAAQGGVPQDGAARAAAPGATPAPKTSSKPKVPPLPTLPTAPVRH